MSAQDAKSALLEWGRSTDRAVGRFVASNRWRFIGGALAAGVAMGFFGVPRLRRGRRRGRCPTCSRRR